VDPYLSRVPSAADSEYFPTFGSRSTSTPAFGPAAGPVESASAEPSSDPDALFGKEGITFHDVLEMFNPLQHLPIVGTIYRELTGDETKPGVRLIGGLLFGGPTGMISAGINNAVQYHTGRDIGGELVAAVTGRPMVTQEAETRLADYKAKHGTMIAADSAPPAALLAANTTQAAPVTDAAAAGAVAAPAAPAAPVAAALQPPAKGSIGVPPVPAFPGGAMPSGLAADATGLSGKAGLPSAGSITPAAIMTQLGQQPAAGGRGTAAVTPAMAAALPVAASIGGSMLPSPPSEAQQAADQAARQQAAQDVAENAAPSLRMPARLSIEPRMPGPGRVTGNRPSFVVPADAVTASAASQMPTTPASDSPIILGTPNAAPASLAPTAQIPDAMLRALDKYDALIKNRRGGKLDQSS
jgi:hypothetical protein